MPATSYLEILKLAAPEAIVVLTALAVLGVDLVVMREQPRPFRFLIEGLVAVFGCVAAIFLMVNLEIHGRLAGGMMVADAVSPLIKSALLILTICTLFISFNGSFTEHVGEYIALILLATTGMMFMVSTENLLMIFVALELTSLSLYILAAFNKRSPQSAEAALKYFLFGGMAAAFTLFGLSLIYGATGSIYLPEIAASLKGQGMDPLLALALVMTVIGLGFKIAAVPFHLWAPDAYQGAPTPSAAFIASGSKVASFYLLARVMMLGFAGAEGSAAWHHFIAGWTPLIAVLAVFSMLIGNLAAIAQSNVKRLLAYSAIAHGGYALLAVLSNSQQGVASLLFYVATYGLTVVGAFGVVAIVEDAAGDSQITSFAGLSRRAPVLSLCMMVFMLSLAGIPPLAGFFGKFYLFVAAAGAAKDLGLLWLVIFAIAMSAVSLYYYLLVLKQIYVVPSRDHTRLHVPIIPLVALGLMAIAVFVLGCAPDFVLSKLLAALGT
jgi:NADH-quinone oxidoreductase subunit N